MPIRLLSSEVASQIAAGEVIERPASVVKELLENSLDAGARSITITIENAGKKLIEVADDGSGIPSAELELAVSRHATSKLIRADDLFSISTLGFRGEALASIGSVSRMTVSSRVENEKEGARLRVEGGKPGKLTKVGTTVGTTVRVEDLFYNIPARLKFLKADVTERRAIDSLVTRYALAYPDKRFKLSDGKNIILQTTGDGDRRAILAALYGVDVARQMLEIMSEEEGFRLTGFVSPTSLTRSNRREITFFINGRWVHDVSLSSALLQAYHTLLMVGRYPLTALLLEIHPEEVDVNVHPTKAEVRFRNQDKVFSFVQRSARKALLAYSPVPNIAPSLWGTARTVPGETTRQVGIDWSIAHDELSVSNEQSPVTTNQSELLPRKSGVESSSFSTIPLLRLIGQIGATYLVAEGPDGLYLVDQHAAHERVLFEKLMAGHVMKNIPSQTLLTPASVTLPPQSANLLITQLPALQHFGFDVEEFGPNTFQVRAMPALFMGSDPSAALRALVEDFEEDETPLQNEIEAKLAARVCKRMAVKAGQALSNEEQRTLLTDLEACDSPRTCPHGRPTMIHLSVDMLERQFGGAVRARHEEFSGLTELFAQYGVESFLKSTNLLVVLLDRDGKLLSWNPSFGLVQQALPDKKLLKDFLSPSSIGLFEELLSSTLRERVRTRGKLRFAHENRRGDFAALSIPLPDEHILFIAEPVHATTELKAVTAELQKTRRSLANKETELKAVIAQADEVAHTDALTFLPNRRQIIGDLQREVIFSDRYGTPLAISMLDIDHFKNINDTYGHPVGDEVLQRLAGELRQHIRQPDTIGRYGGEEFLVILPHSMLKAATEQAERLCRHVRSLLMKAGKEEVSLTISLGIAQYKTHREDWQAFLSRADVALYQAKNNGRDQWAVSEE